MEIDAILKEAREEKNISLESLKESTKIQKRYLKAIEQGNFHILPGTFYARAFIKEYAEAVGLNAEELLAEHKNELPTSQPKEDVQYTRMQRTRRESQSNKDPIILSVIPKIIVVLLVIGIIFITFLFYKKSIEPSDSDPVNDPNNNEVIRNDGKDSDDEDSAPNNENTLGENDADNEASGNNDEDDPEENNSENNDEEEPELSLVQEGSGSKPESTFELTNAGEEVILLLEPSGESWLGVENGDGDDLYQGLTEADTPIELDVSGEERIYLNIGSAPNLPTIYIDDVEFEYPVDPNQFVTQRIWFNITYAADE